MSEYKCNNCWHEWAADEYEGCPNCDPRSSLPAPACYAATSEPPVSRNGRCPHCGDYCYTRLWGSIVICDVCCKRYTMFRGVACRMQHNEKGQA